MKCHFNTLSEEQYWEMITVFQIFFLVHICWYISGANIDKRSGRFFPFTDISSHKAQSTAHNSVIAMKKYMVEIVTDEFDKI